MSKLTCKEPETSIIAEMKHMAAARVTIAFDSNLSIASVLLMCSAKISWYRFFGSASVRQTFKLN